MEEAVARGGREGWREEVRVVRWGGSAGVGVWWRRVAAGRFGAPLRGWDVLCCFDPGRCPGLRLGGPFGAEEARGGVSIARVRDFAPNRESAEALGWGAPLVRKRRMVPRRRLLEGRRHEWEWMCAKGESAGGQNAGAAIELLGRPFRARNAEGVYRRWRYAWTRGVALGPRALPWASVGGPIWGGRGAGWGVDCACSRFCTESRISGSARLGCTFGAEEAEGAASAVA